jgi:hypothetical protein
MKSFEIDIDGIGSNIKCILTPIGEAKVHDYLHKLADKRKEFIDAGKDTADNINFPTEDDIISDIEAWFGTDGIPQSCNGSLCLHLGHEIVTVKAAECLQFSNAELINSY